jgi:hypothetical protein
MKYVWKDRIVAVHRDDQDLTGKYPGAVILQSSAPAAFVTGETKAVQVLADEQDPQFLADTGLERVNGVWALGLGGAIIRRSAEIRAECRRRINDRWPPERQHSRDAARQRRDQDALIDAAELAIGAVNGAHTAEEVDSVIVNWPEV